MFYYHYEATEIVDNWRWKVVSWKSNWSIQNVFYFKTCSKYQKRKFELSFLQMQLAVFWGGRISVRTGKDMWACSSCFQYFLDKQLFRPYKEPWWYPLCAISVKQNLRTLHEKKHIKCNKHLHDARYFYTILVYQRGPFAYRQIKCFDTKCFFLNTLCVSWVTDLFFNFWAMFVSITRILHLNSKKKRATILAHTIMVGHTWKNLALN